MRFRRTAVPVTERAAAGVLCLVPCFLFPKWTYLRLSKLRHAAVRKNYEDETRHPSTGGTDGGAGC